MSIGRLLITDMSGAAGHYSTHRLVEVMNNIPRGVGVMSGKLMTEDAELSCPESPSRARCGSVRGGRGGRGRGSVVWAVVVSPRWQVAGGPSGLGDLLAARGAGREPGGGALLRAEAVLVLFLNFCQ